LESLFNYEKINSQNSYNNNTFTLTPIIRDRFFVVRTFLRESKLYRIKITYTHFYASI